ncbi:hypothetical protein GCM10010300_22200 [Streptomyces olivaceoviridis]|nr:hypothetical protein GCM10010300_22200 [Streptomyces olivaceoviridis]
MVVSVPQERGKKVLFGTFPPRTEHLRTATDGGPAPFGPTRDPLAAGRPKPLSTERPGPTRVTPGRPAGTFPSSARALSLAPSDGAPVRHTVPDPAALRRVG